VVSGSGVVGSGSGVVGSGGSLSLGTGAARNLASTTKSVPQMQGISSRWLLRLLPWVEVSGGVFRVNRRLSFAVGDGRVSFASVGARVEVIPRELCELSVLRGFDDVEVLGALADRFVQREFGAGQVIVEAGSSADELVVVAHGKVSKVGEGEFGGAAVLGSLVDGDYVGDRGLVGEVGVWGFSVRAVTACTVMVLSRSAFMEVLEGAPGLRAHVEGLSGGEGVRRNKHGEAAIEVASGHVGEPDLPNTFVDYELGPREYELSVAQTVLRVHSRVVDLFNDPMDQLEQQLRLTVEALRERQEHELVNNREFGLLHNADLKQRIHTRTGPPTPDDLDELLASVWKDPAFFLAHPRAIAAFGRECSRRGVYPQSVQVNGSNVPAWRGVPIFPCNKIPISDKRTSSIMVMRTGSEKQGVVGLRQTGLPDEYEPGLSVRFMGIDDKALISYLVSTYYSAAVMVPDALGVLEHVEVAHPDDA
jgi:hypothetical protein